jgi:hypothetical protein
MATNQKRGNDQTVPLLSSLSVIAGETIDPLAVILRQPSRRHNAPMRSYRPDSVSAAFTRGVAKLGIEEVLMVSRHRDWNKLRRCTRRST